ncbi:tRNA pseudouridine(13) synthase TruD [Candidatus Micrarchaeota archaeon]|nr:tRNA pseudouridine(13) synthase TruD [Candidatus Micrarchaeota archaeon]
MNYLSKTPGIGGTIKSKPEDFLVEEIMPDGTLLEIDKQCSIKDEEGKFTHFILQKKDWSTSSALYEIAKRLAIGQKRISFAGTKDKTAVSTQRVSVFDIPKERVLDLKIKDMQINGAWYAKDKVRLGQLLGNRFTIRVEGAENVEKVKQISSELDGRFPNYFGEQRFGSTRRNTHLIGLKMLQGKFDEAVEIFLCDSDKEQNPQAQAARNALKQTKNYKQALIDFPKHLQLERKLISYLMESQENYVEALKRLPRPILLMFIHALQSHIFNQLLSNRIENNSLEPAKGEYYCGEKNGFPDIKKFQDSGWVVGKLIGYETPLNEQEKTLLEELGIEKDDFRMNEMPEIASKGTYRTLLAPIKDFNFNSNTFRFTLPAGSYATVLMGEFLDEK